MYSATHIHTHTPMAACYHARYWPDYQGQFGAQTFRSTVLEHCGFSVSYSENERLFFKLCGDIEQLKSGQSVETLQTCHLPRHHLNVSISRTRPKQTEGESFSPQSSGSRSLLI